jgi:prepilin-type N-terminal cleavage/methylation domain-containing protein
MNHRSGRNGYTLVEMVITLVVLSILAAFSASFIGNLTETYTLMERQRGLHQEAAIAIDRISRELRDAASVATPTTTTPSSALVFERVHGTGVDGNTWVSFSLSGTYLIRQSNTTNGSYPAGKVLAGNVSAFSTTLTGTAGAEDARYTVSITTSSGGQGVTYAVTVTPKNCAAVTAWGGRCFSGDFIDIVQ